MRRNPLARLRRAFVTGCVLAAVAEPHALRAAPLDSPAVARLTEAGFENVSVLATESDLVVRYENRIFRYEMHAIGLAAAAALSEAGERRLSVVTLHRGVPVASLAAPAGSWRAFLDGAMDADEFSAALTVSDRAAAASEAVEGPANSSYLRLDLQVRPLFAFELGIADDPFRSSAYLAPEALVVPTRGFLATVQGAVRIYDDLDSFSRAVGPGRSTLSWGGWLPGGWLTAASGGYFPGNRYGFAAEASRLLADGMVELRVGGDYSGFLKFSRDVTLYSGLDAWSLFAAGTVRPSPLDLAVTVTAARFMEGDPGGRLDVSRRWRETELGFFAVGTEEATVVGFRIEVALPVAETPRPRAVRFTTVPAFPFQYRDTSEDAGLQVSLFDNTARMRKGLYPTFVRNNLRDLRAGASRWEREANR